MERENWLWSPLSSNLCWHAVNMKHSHTSHMIGESYDTFYMRNGMNHLKSLFVRQIMLLCPFVFQHHRCCDNGGRGRVSPEGRISTQLDSGRGRGQLIIVPSSPGTERGHPQKRNSLCVTRVLNMNLFLCEACF